MAFPMDTRGKGSGPSNSFQTRLHEAVSASVAKPAGNLKVSSPVLQQAPARQTIGAPRQSPVARTRATAAQPGNGVVAYVANPVIAVPNSSTAPAATPDIPGRPTDVIANLLQQNPAPTPYTPTWQPSTNPALFMTYSYY